MSLIKAIRQQLGLSATPANNFTLDASADNGTMKLARNSGQDIMTVDAAGKVAFPAQGQSLTADGYIRLPGGLIIQWGNGNVTTTAANTPAAAAGDFPIPFPTGLLALLGNATMSGSTNQIITVNPASPTLSQWSFRGVSSVAGAAIAFTWIAIGY